MDSLQVNRMFRFSGRLPVSMLIVVYNIFAAELSFE